jgi:hypothetical protein
MGFEDRDVATESSVMDAGRREWVAPTLKMQSSSLTAVSEGSGSDCTTRTMSPFPPNCPTGSIF